MDCASKATQMGRQFRAERWRKGRRFASANRYTFEAVHEGGRMLKLSHLKSLLAGIVSAVFVGSVAVAETFSIPPGDLSAALDAYTVQTGIGLIVSADAVKGVQTKGVRGDISSNTALSQILAGTGFVEHREATAIAIVRSTRHSADDALPAKIAAASTPTTSGTSLETVTVTSSKIGGAICRTFRFRSRRCRRNS